MNNHPQSDIDQNKGEKKMENKINAILSDIEAYEKVIDDAQNALAAAEQELAEELDAELAGQ